MSDNLIYGPMWVESITKLDFNTKTGELAFDFSTPMSVGEPIKMRLHLSQEATQALALNLARCHKFLDEQLEGTPVTNALQ
ncbi:hypothetical protein I7V28_01145 [Lelliottia amnigena]|uniref:hypothetical protein n=1 Tax=Lelliottia amnigena TaxID=61646 RepID=UPI00192B3612|nr:hypothetical protein [Lelliottia amnigena]MBL5919741.1 hypothetical protein [Lelliottia amnigena]